MRNLYYLVGFDNSGLSLLRELGDVSGITLRQVTKNKVGNTPHLQLITLGGRAYKVSFEESNTNAWKHVIRLIGKVETSKLIFIAGNYEGERKRTMTSTDYKTRLKSKGLEYPRIDLASGIMMHIPLSNVMPHLQLDTRLRTPLVETLMLLEYRK